MADTSIEQVEQSATLSVQTQRDKYFMGGSIYFAGGYNDYANSIPSVYDPRRQWILNRIDAHPQNNLWQGAVARINHKVSGTSAEISGKRRVKWYQDLIMFNSQDGKGFGAFLETLLRDYFRCDDGAVIEIIGRGDPDTHLEKEAIVGIKVLDPLRCYFTMNQEYPVWYQDSVSGRLHMMHYTRVHRLVDQPFSDPELRGRGLCALSRAIGFVQQAIVNQTYVGEMLSHDMPPGILLVNGVVEKKWKDAWALYTAALMREGVDTYKPIITYTSPEGVEVTIEFIPFSAAPTNYNPIELTELQAKGIALGLDTDPNDILPMQGGNFGVNGQSKILDQKNRDGGFTHLLKMLERFFNVRILPDPLKFEWKYRDSEQSMMAADIASRHMTIAQGLIGLAVTNTAIDPRKMAEVAMRYLAENVQSLGDILRDESGELVNLYDNDPADEVPDADQIADDVVTDPAANAPDAVTATDGQTAPPEIKATKDYEDTRYDFTRDFAGVVIEANSGGIESRRRAGTILRSILSKYGRKATIDGLVAGGVETDTLEGSDLDTFLGWQSAQSGYVTDFTARIWSKGLSDPQIYASVEAWANKSLASAYTNGLISADRNGLYEFYGDDGTESCSDCQRLKGKKFRLVDWYASGYLPDASTCKLECGGFNCQHKIRKTTGRANSKSLIGLKMLTGMITALKVRHDYYHSKN